MFVLTSSQIAEIEKTAINEIGINELILMENAASAITDVISKLNKNIGRAAVLCGKGNNGGDGFACARKLIAKGIKTTIFHSSDISNFSNSALVNYNILKHTNTDLKQFKPPYNFNEYDIIIDALFGTGLKRNIIGEYKEIIDAANNASGLKLAVDIPSGLMADASSVPETVFNADITVTFIGMKICHSLYPSKEKCGKIYISKIDIPDSVINKSCNIFYSDFNTLPKIRKRLPDTHKGNYGHSLLIGGSYGKGGALFMASLSAIRAGAGLVTAAYPHKCGGYFMQTPEIMTLPLKNDCFLHKNDTEEAINFINNNKISSVCIGNGAGRNEETKIFIKNIVKSVSKPLIIDADGINAIDLKDLKEIKTECAITPHLAEFSRLTGISLEEIKKNPINIASEFAKEYNKLLVLKSADTIIASPSGKITICSHGTPSLAKGGSGDCLAGIIAGLSAGQYNLEESAELACFIIGKSAKIEESHNNENTIITRDIINNFGAAFNELYENT